MREVAVIAGCVAVASAIMAAMGFRGREQIVGIDLGTTFSVVAIKTGREGVKVLPDRRTGKLLVPSVVSYFQNGTAVVGAEAAARRGSHPLYTIYNSKRFIGRRFEDVAMDAGTHPYRVEANATGGAAGFAIGAVSSPGRWVSPIDVGAEIVSHLKKSVSEYMGYDIYRAVICVPAKFGAKEAEATRRAFEQAGFKVMRVMDEPTAAAVAYGLHKTNQVKTVLVYDIGGGTLDTSLLYMNGKTVSVLGVSGDDHLGGSDFDLVMLRLLQEKLAKAAGEGAAEPGLPQCGDGDLRVLAESAKIELSSQESAEVRCAGSDGLIRRWSVGRSDFEGAAAGLFARAIDPVKTVLQHQMMTADDVDDIVLVGGASRMPHLRALLQEFFGQEKRLHTEIDPDVTVAYGAANIVD